MKNVPNTKFGRMYAKHISMVEKKDIEGLMNQYTDDCVLISSFEKKPIIYRGKKQLRVHMNGILGIKGIKTRVRFWAETKNTVMVTEGITMKTPDNKTAHMIFADSWVIKRGRIAIHFAGMVQHADGSLA